MSREIKSDEKPITTSQLCEKIGITLVELNNRRKRGLDIKPERRCGQHESEWLWSKVEKKLPESLKPGVGLAKPSIRRGGAEYILIPTRDEKRPKGHPFEGHPCYTAVLRWHEEGCLLLPPDADGKPQKLRGFFEWANSPKRRHAVRRLYVHGEQYQQILDIRGRAEPVEIPLGFIRQARLFAILGMNRRGARKALAMAERYIGRPVDTAWTSAINTRAFKRVQLFKESDAIALRDRIVELAKDPTVITGADAFRTHEMPWKGRPHFDQWVKECPYLPDRSPLEHVDERFMKVGRIWHWLKVYAVAKIKQIEEGWKNHKVSDGRQADDGRFGKGHGRVLIRKPTLPEMRPLPNKGGRPSVSPKAKEMRIAFFDRWRNAKSHMTFERFCNDEGVRHATGLAWQAWHCTRKKKGQL